MSKRNLTQIVAHRGGALLWPENSLEAFRRSLTLGVDQLECDVHLSADGVPVVIHDPTLDRTTLGQGPVAMRSVQELQATQLRGSETDTVPPLSDLAALLAGTTARLQVEIKGTQTHDLLQRSLDVLDQAGIRDRCLIIAFDAGVAAAAQQAGGLADIIWLFGARHLREVGVDGAIATARHHGFRFVETEIGALDEAAVAAFRQAGLKVAAWGANDAATLEKAFNLELDAVATDDPVLALRLRGA
jgi:glycerophosphoryl diester phosphodiesterase